MSKKKNKEFVLSDESRNSYGFRILTAGINLENFIKNPVMFYNHDRTRGVIGRWANIRYYNKKLLATPEFDMKDATGLKIAQKIEDGFIRAASIGIEVLTVDAKGETVLSCNLIECSICDVPSNGNALMLYHDGEQVKDEKLYVNLNLIKNKIPMNEDLKKIIEALGLNPDATIDDILSAIASLSGETPGQIVENAISMNVIKDYEKPGLLKMAQMHYPSFVTYMKNRKTEVFKERQELSHKLVNAAVYDGRLLYPANSKRAKSFWLKAFESDFEETKFVLENLNKRQTISSQVKEITGNDRGVNRDTWTLKDYRKKAPHLLAADPGLYERLIEEEKISQTK